MRELSITGRCDVHLVDSQFISCLQGAMAIEAAGGAGRARAVEIVRHIVWHDFARYTGLYGGDT